jgi:hypothetical protein
MPESVFMKLGMYIMAPEPISAQYFNKLLPSVCVSVCVSLIVDSQRLGKNPLIVIRQRLDKHPLIVARQRLSKNVTTAANTRATIKELLDTLFSMRSVSYEEK